MNNQSWRHRWRWLAFLLTAITLTWAAWLLWQSLPAVINSLPKLKTGWLLFTLLGCTLSAYIGFEGFRILFNSICPRIYSRTELAHLYFTGQVMKHLPGRIWSLAYQSAAGKRASVSQWIGVTIIHMALTILFSAWVSTSIISWQYDWRMGSASILLGIIIYILIWNNRLVKDLLKKVQEFPVTWIRKASSTIHPLSVENNLFKIKVLTLFTVGWIIYFVAWAGYGAAWPELRPTDGIWLCALYTIAWLAGYLSFLSPSGLGVRELVFITLAHDFPDDAVAGMAILGRTTLLLVDIILGIAFISCREPTHERP